MESFKKALKQAIVDKADGVRFEEGQAPSLMLFANERTLSQLGALDKNSLLNLINSLIPNAFANGEVLSEGVLNITNFGELKLLAISQDIIRLFAFIPPQGTSLYQQVKNQFLSPQTKAPVRAIDLPPPQDEGPAPALAPRGQFGSSSPNTAHGTIGGGSRVEESPIHSPLPFATQEAMDPLAMYAPPTSPATDPMGGGSGTLVRPRFDMPAEEDPLAKYAPLGNHESFAPPTSEARPFQAQMDSPEPLPSSHASPLDYQTHNPVLPDYSGTYVSSPLPPDLSETMSYTAQGRGTAMDFVPTQIAAAAPTHAQSPHTMPISQAPAPVTAPKEIVFGPSVPGESIIRTGSFAIDSILENMVRKKASDLHLTMKEPVCLRVDGEIHRVGSEPITEDQMRQWILPIMPPKNREEFATIHDTDFAYEVPGLARFRVNVFRDRMGVGAVLRQIPDKVLSADDLGLPAAIRKLCELNKGLVVVTGPTGSGKSTTLAAMIDLINETRSDHILTIEDPIEFVHKQKKCLINQREVHKHTQSFSRALRAALREDPDIILIGEMRDLETVEIAIETAETGHLVFGTLHTNTAISTVDRLIDQFPSEQQEQVRIMLAESLKGVVAQTLVKKKGGGRCAAQEILIVDKAVSSLIREGNTHMMQNQMQTQKSKGNQLLNDALLALVQKGLIDPKDAYTKAIEKEALLTLFQQKGITLDVAKSA